MPLWKLNHLTRKCPIWLSLVLALWCYWELKWNRRRACLVLLARRRTKPSHSTRCIFVLSIGLEAKGGIRDWYRMASWKKTYFITCHTGFTTGHCFMAYIRKIWEFTAKHTVLVTNQIVGHVVMFWLVTLKADSHITCRAHAVPLPCRAAKGLERVFPIWFTHCGRVWFALAMSCPCHAPTMPFFSRPQHSTAIERRPCCTVALRRLAWSEYGMDVACVNQTRPHCVNQMGKTF